MSVEKYRQLVDELVAKTEAGRLVWKETADSGTFQVSFPRYSIIITQKMRNQINYLAPPYAVYEIQILNAEGRRVDLFSDNILGDEYQKRVTNLYQHAQRQALGADKALDEILNTLRGAR